ncbi:MAG: ABC transporter substrate-binding protein [Acidimicrobiales bacterium]
MTLLCCVVLVSGCSATSASSGGGKSAIVIGTFGAQSGPFAVLSTVTNGTSAYFDELNASGGIGGRKVTLKIANDQYNPSLTPGAVRQLVSDGSSMICAGFGSSDNLAVKSYLKLHQIPDVAPGTGTPSLFSPVSSTEFGVIPPFQREAANLARFLVQDKHATSIGMAYEDDTVGIPALDGVKEELQTLGQSLVAAVPFAVTSTSLATQAAQLKAAGAKYVIVWSVASPMVLLVNAAKTLGFTPQWSGPYAAESPSTLAATSGALTGSYWETWLQAANGPQAAPIQAALTKYFPKDKLVTALFIQGWELADVCAKVLMKASASGSVTPASISKAASNFSLTDQYIHGLSWTSQSHIGNVDEHIDVAKKNKDFVSETGFQPIPNVKF